MVPRFPLTRLPDFLVQRIFSFCPSKAYHLSVACKDYKLVIVPAMHECLNDACRGSCPRSDDEIDDAFQSISKLANIKSYMIQLQNLQLVLTACNLWSRLRARLGRRTWIAGITICCLAFKDSRNGNVIRETIGSDVFIIGKNVVPSLALGQPDGPMDFISCTYIGFLLVAMHISWVDCPTISNTL
jgi:hypothetical protein